MPFSYIAIMALDHLINTKLDYVLILPWNIAKEIKMQNATIKERKFMLSVIKLKIL